MSDQQHPPPPSGPLHRVVWIGARLRGSNLAGVDLEGADLRASDLRGTNFTGSNLRYVDFRGANATGANFQNANLYGARMQGVDARQADFRGANVEQVNFAGAYLEGAFIPHPHQPPPRPDQSLTAAILGNPNAFLTPEQQQHNGHEPAPAAAGEHEKADGMELGRSG
jgi:uncharacterized protein YjbI with pentapeptide repeats